MLRVAGLLIASLLGVPPVQAWDAGESRQVALNEVGIHIVNGDTVFFLRTNPMLPFPWDPASECFYSKLLGFYFFTAAGDNPTFVKQSMYMMALNAASGGGHVTLTRGACVAPPGDGTAFPGIDPSLGLENAPLIKIEKITISK